MATTVARLQAVLSADTRDFDRGLDRSEKRMGGVAKAAGFAGLAIAGGLGVAAKVGFDEMRQGELVTAQLEAVLKSTGGVANVTAGQVDTLASALMKKSGVDDEQIKSGENMLLTFTKVRNEVGAGNDVFTQATKTTLDLSVAMGKDMQSSAILVGKALNDPIKGISALSRVGVQLDEDQKKLIKTMVASGDTMGAQKVILKELETQFGGSAAAAGKTMAGQMNIAKESFANMTGQLMTALLPAINQLVAILISATSYLSEHDTVAKVVVATLGLLAGLLGAVAVATRLWSAATAIATAAQWLWNTAMAANPIGLVVIAIAALTAGIILAYKNSETFRDIVDTVWRTLRTTVMNAVNAIVGFVDDMREKFNAFKGWLSDNWKTGLVILLTGLPGLLWAAFQSKWAEGFRDPIYDVFRNLRNWVKEHFVDPIVDWISGIIDKVGGLVDAIKGAVGKLSGLAGKLPGIGDAFNPNMTWPGAGATDSGYTGSVNLMGARPEMLPFALAAAAKGLVVTSGLRPGAITANGTPSDHGFGKALDVAGPASGMAAFFRSLLGNAAVKQAFYDPLGSIFGGRWSSYREGGHSDHVHVATYDKGGYLKPGWNLAYNGLGRPEPVGFGGVTVNVYGDVSGDEIVEKVRTALIRLTQRNGSTGIG